MENYGNIRNANIIHERESFCFIRKAPPSLPPPIQGNDLPRQVGRGVG